MSQAALERVKQIGGWHTYGEQYLRLMKQLVSASP
jgi:hypothetical protein